MKTAPTWTLLLATTCVAGCSSRRLAPEERLPFHVAIATLQDSTLREYAETSDALETTLEVNTAAFGQELESALSKRCFVRTTLLDAPIDQDEAVAQAVGAGANLLLTSRLWHANEVEQELNAWSTGSFLVFLVGGPFCWFFPDRTYSAELGVTVTLHDLSEHYVLEEYPELKREAVEYFEHSENLGDLQLDFFDRAGDSYGYYAASILIPSPFLATDHEGLADDFPELAIEALAEELAAGLYDRRLELLRNVTRYDYYLLTNEVVFARAPSGDLQLSWSVLHDQEQGLNEPGTYRVRAGGFDRTFEVTDVQLERGVTTETGQVLHRFTVTLDGVREANEVQIWLHRYGDMGRARGYTLPVPDTL